ncbi:hypothetical protein [Mesorhizobium sp.]|uniref:hypothetical protein n=1 Tax=Mesorhizobium sp. TaxID=1871066 RepID=UPI000FE7A6E7|nr:hypothetical protein [Mesorhizobium sp.]RWP50675.1 MAG: hypothetical protein EOR05_05555 [Mesorhizobium sp.]
MRDSELTDRPGRGWTPWAEGTGESAIDKIWWAARVLHFPKLNVSCWFDGSDLVGIEYWGYRQPQWCMRKKPADWQPLPDVYRLAREEEKLAAIERFQAGVQARALQRLIQASEKRRRARGAESGRPERALVGLLRANPRGTGTRAPTLQPV